MECYFYTYVLVAANLLLCDACRAGRAHACCGAKGKGVVEGPKFSAERDREGGNCSGSYIGLFLAPSKHENGVNLVKF